MKTRDEVMQLLETKYPGMFLRTTEEFSGSEGGIWTSGEDGPRASDGRSLFNYYSEDYSTYDIGVHTEIFTLLEDCEWYCEWHDAGTIMIWPN